MIAGMGDARRAALVAALAGGTQLPGRPRPDGTTGASRFVDLGPDFEAHRAAVESVSVLFTLHDGTGATYAQTGEPGRQLPSGWQVRAAKFEVEWPADPERARLVKSHFGARRFAYNWALGQVKADLDAREADPGHKSAGWGARELRAAWNQAKAAVAPWHAGNSKESYACGIADLARALANWKAGKNGTRKGNHRGSPGSPPPAATPGASGSPPVPCAWNPTAAPSSCPSSGPCAQRRAPAGSSGTSPPATPASST